MTSVFIGKRGLGGLAALCGLAAAQGGTSSFRGAAVPQGMAAMSRLDPAHPEPAKDLPQGIYGVKNLNSGKYLNVIDGSTDNFANVQQWDNLDSEHSLWRLSRVSVYGHVHIQGGVPGVYLLQNVYSEMYLSVADGSAADGANVRQQKDWASLAAQWLIQVVSQKAVALQNVATGKWLNVEGGGLHNGFNIQQWNSNLQNHSWFTLEAPHCRPESAECNPWADISECCMEGAGNKTMSCDIQPQAGWGYCKDTSK